MLGNTFVNLYEEKCHSLTYNYRTKSISLSSSIKTAIYIFYFFKSSLYAPDPSQALSHKKHTK